MHQWSESTQEIKMCPQRNICCVMPWQGRITMKSLFNIWQYWSNLDLANYVLRGWFYRSCVYSSRATIFDHTELAEYLISLVNKAHTHMHIECTLSCFTYNCQLYKLNCFLASALRTTITFYYCFQCCILLMGNIYIVNICLWARCCWDDGVKVKMAPDFALMQSKKPVFGMCAAVSHKIPLSDANHGIEHVKPYGVVF